MNKSKKSQRSLTRIIFLKNTIIISLIASVLILALAFSGCSAVAGLFKKSLFSSPDAQSQAQGSKDTSVMEGTKDDEGSVDKDKSQAEDEGNKSGKVPGEGGAVSFYDPDGGITLSFLPDTMELSSVQWMQKMGKNIIVSFSKAGINSFSDDSISIAGYTKELAQQDIAKLKEGSFGPNVDFGYEPSQKVIKLNGTYAKDFLILSRFEVCNVTFEREIIFYRGNFQYIINIMGIEDRIKNSIRQYFKTDSENCGDELVWDFNKQGQFYNALTGGTASEEAMEWYNASEDVVKSLAIAENGPEVLEGSLVISNKQTALNSTEKNYTITASYPELLISGQAGMLASINEEISDVVNEQVGTFKKDMESVDTAAEDTPEDWPVFVNMFRGDYSILLSHGNRFLSIPFIFYYFTGGAHGNSFNVTLNYDLKNHSRIELKNIFKPGFDYVSFISDYCIEDIKNQNRQMGFEPDEKWIKEGASANEENFRNFVLNDDELIIIFDPYEVAPYAAGSVFVKIPFDKIRENIDIF